MGLEILLFAVVILGICAVVDLIVGVSNDAVNFLNSPIGSNVATKKVIIIIAALGILAGVIFSKGMMEVARKGIFHPQFFTMPELITIFLGVMLTDVILLDLFNTFGLPTSTTVSVVFELLGGAVAVSILKIVQSNSSLLTLNQYINTAKAMVIIFGILFSVIVAFFFGAIVQFISRMIFTFDYKPRLKKYGAVWGSIALTSITYFILIKGAKGAAFITPEMLDWIKSNTWTVLTIIAIISFIVLQILLFLKLNILKPIILIGTFALAMAFAANDLVNFIGVPIAGLHSYRLALASDTPLTVSMIGLAKKVPSETFLLLIAGIIMGITLWFSKKARTVTQTTLSLGQQEEGEERFESIFLSRILVKMWINLYGLVKMLVPLSIRKRISKRIDINQYQQDDIGETTSSFDLLRASVNLMVASAIISYATSHKLPLSTTYVTFMVAMGASFADKAWGRESAVYRITGVLTVIGGWFMTAMLAFIISSTFAAIIFLTKQWGLIVLLILVAIVVKNTHRKHKEKRIKEEEKKIYNLRKVTDAQNTFIETFKQMSSLLEEIRVSVNNTFDNLFLQNTSKLRKEQKRNKDIQKWTNIIVANIFKGMRLLQKSDVDISNQYSQTGRRLQKLADAHRDIVSRSYIHIRNHHKGLLNVQIEELKKVQKILDKVLLEVETTLNQKISVNYESVIAQNKKLEMIADRLNENQTNRIVDNTSKTRLTILFYALLGNCMIISKQNIKLLEIFQKSYKKINN